MSVREEIAKSGMSNGAILELFREAEDELIYIIEHIDPKSKFRVFRRQQLRSIQATIQRLERNARSWASEELPKIVEAGAKETFEDVKKFKEKDFPVKFSGVDTDTLNIFIENAYLDFGTTMVGLTKNAQKAALQRRAIQSRILKGLVSGSSVSRTQRGVMRELKKSRFTVLKAKNGFGRRFSLQSYSNMLVRTQNVTAYNLGSKSQLLNSGRRYAIFPTIRPDIDGPDICNEWERKKYVDLLRDPLPPASTHPNCRHTLLPVSFQELKAERPDLYRKAKLYYDRTVAG